jgi:hypothetical protein
MYFDLTPAIQSLLQLLLFPPWRLCFGSAYLPFDPELIILFYLCWFLSQFIACFSCMWQGRGDNSRGAEPSPRSNPCSIIIASVNSVWTLTWLSVLVIASLMMLTGTWKWSIASYSFSLLIWSQACRKSMYVLNKPTLCSQLFFFGYLLHSKYMVHGRSAFPKTCPIFPDRLISNGFKSFPYNVLLFYMS